MKHKVFPLKLTNSAPKSNAQRFERILAGAALVTILLAWLVGALRAEADVRPFLTQALPEADRFEALSSETYAAWKKEAEERVIGYVTISTADGYGGPLKVAVAVDPEGNLLGLTIMDQKETPSFLRRVLEADLLAVLKGKSYRDAFNLGQDIDGVTGATYTTRALVEAARQGSRTIAGTELGLAVPAAEPAKIRFGAPEIVLIALYVVGYIGHRPRFRYKKQIRWLSMLAGLVFLGFFFNSPLTLAFLNKLLLGFWPAWQTHLYWYLLLGGILFAFTVHNRNPYCDWFCPFGAAQECLGVVGGARVRTPPQYRRGLQWLQRGLAWLAIVLAFLWRNPALSSYELFGTLFSLTGSSLQFALLALVLLASLYFRRPWCNYLCPLPPVTDLIRLIRKWVRQQWRRTGLRPNA